MSKPDSTIYRCDRCGFERCTKCGAVRPRPARVEFSALDFIAYALAWSVLSFLLHDLFVWLWK